MKKVLFFIFGMVCLIFMASITTQAARVNVAPAAFHSVNGAADQLSARWGWADYVFRPVGSTEDQHMAQVDLPHNVIIKYVRLHYMDNDGSNDMAIALVRCNKYTGTTNSLYVIWTSGASSAVQFADDFSVSPSPSYALTNTDACSYHIYLDMNGIGEANQRLYGVTVVY